jgi:uncharacterized protein (TIGR02996 family)
VNGVNHSVEQAVGTVHGVNGDTPLGSGRAAANNDRPGGQLMSDRAALVAAVAAAGDDDLPKLVFADWLDENGEPDRATDVRTNSARSGTRRRPTR